MTEEIQEKIRHYAFYFEKHSYDQVLLFMKDLSPTDFFDFNKIFLDLDLLGEIARHKNNLAIRLANACGVEALPDDRQRMIFTIAMHYRDDFATLNASLIKDLGEHFYLKESYLIGQKKISWQEIVKRSKEIQVGFANISYLAVESQVLVMVRLYKASKEADPEKIKQIDQLALDVLVKTVDFIRIPPSAPEMQDKMPLINNFYKTTGRLQIDIDSLIDRPDIEEAITFITITKAICEVKLSLIKRRIPLTDYDVAEYEFRRIMAINYFDNNLVSLDEMKREKVPLKQLGAAATQAPSLKGSRGRKGL
ncbi:MAG: hypothetical protein Q7S80_02095 [bacterium]|nr:hypothetical protein [bacterium]